MRLAEGTRGEAAGPADLLQALLVPKPRFEPQQSQVEPIGPLIGPAIVAKDGGAARQILDQLSLSIQQPEGKASRNA